MKYTPALTLLLVMLSPLAILDGATPFRPSISEEDSTVKSADQQFLRVLSARDVSATARLLYPDFSWIDSRGRRLDTTEFLKILPAAANADAPAEARVYGKTAVVHIDRGQVHVKRIWVKQSSGWQLLLYQEVTQVEKSEPAGGVPSAECVNPCKTIPFEPQTQSEKEAVASWQGVMSAMAENDAGAYAPLIADEFTATDTYHDRPYTKADRLSQIAKQKTSGSRSAPPELLSAQMFDFGDSVVMIAREQRKEAKAYFNTRMWVKRDGRWQMLFSFNTRID
jgi:ketosteroid isomerase-like protein